MKRDAIKNKLIYFAFLLSVCAGLMLVSYYGFLQTVDIDVMLGIDFVYTGESGGAQVSAISRANDLNQRIQEFMNTVTYTIDPDEGLSNGDVIQVTASYDADVAAEYHFQPVNTTAAFVVEGLPERYAHLADIPESYIRQSEQAAARYLHMEGQAPVYGAFLHGDSDTVRDRFLWMWQVEDGRFMIVLVPDVNDSNSISESAINSQQAYLSAKEQEDHDYAGYVKRLFDGDSTIEELDSGDNGPLVSDDQE